MLPFGDARSTNELALPYEYEAKALSGWIGPPGTRDRVENIFG